MTIKKSLILTIFLLLTAALAATAADGPDRTAKKLYNKGVKAYEKNDFSEARKNLKEAIENYPDYADAYYTLGRIALAEKQTQQAFDYFSKATRIDPTHSQAQLEMGRILMAARMPEEALLRIEVVLKNDPGNLDALLVKGSALLAQKRSAEGIKILSPLFEKGERNRDLILLLAAAHFRKGEAPLGESVLKAGLKAHPEDIALHLQLAGAHQRAGDLKAAQAIMQKVIEIDPTNAAYPITLARLYWETKENQKADQVLEKALKENPDDPARRIAVANFYLEKKQIDRAQQLLIEGFASGDPGARLRLSLSELYLKTNRPQEAIDLLEKGLKETQASETDERIRIHNALAKIYLAAKEIDTAKAYAENVLKQDPANLQALVTRGMALKSGGKADAAIQDFKQVLRRKPDFVQGYLQLADAYAMQRKTGMARKTLDAGLRLASADRELLMASYRVCLMEKDYKQAEQHLLDLVDKYPQAIDAQAMLGDFYLALNDESAARREFSEIVLKSPRSAVGHIKLARLYARQGQTDSAIAQLQKGLGLVEDNQALSAELVTVWLSAERFDDALVLCDNRLKANPEEAFAHYLKGRVFSSMKKYDDARKAFEKAAEIDPMWPEAGNSLAAVYLLQDKKKEAIDHFEETLAHNPKNSTATLVLGRLYEERNEYDKAIKVYENGVGKVPGFWSAANRLAFLLADRATSVETLDRALKIASAAYRMKPGQAAIIDTLGWIYYKKGETERSLHLYEKLIAAAPEDPVVNYHMGVVLKKSGDIDTAREKLQTATRSEAKFYGRDHAEALLRELTNS
ncbi:tetratricopeptide repeat protein [uncultured Desulfosarcina sp.]|uniref:tetratricopeptide repeat protein n=1 Tax=uncultured Desulfosarcina sp. TaxID=218289 RepID=UPI0029C773D8|nr:tetratricopeptide repeat protein [uncultured Desulfosarcina sp.]